MAVPKLRFSEFVDEWENRKIGELCSEFKSGKNIKADDINLSGEYPVYGGNGLRGYSDTYNHDGTYAIIGRQGALCGNMTLVVGKNYVTEHAIAVQGNKSNNTIFLFYLLGTMNLGQYSGQSAQPGLAVNKLIKLSASVPALQEQKKIAAFLSSIDDIIQVQEEEISTLEEQKRGVMQKLFNQEVRFKEDDGGEYPEWNKEKWGSIGQFLKSGNLSKSDLSEEGTPCILYGELYTKYKEIANVIHSKTNTPCEVVSKKGDVIIPKSGETPEDISTATYIPYDGVALGGDLIIFRSDCISGSYLSYLIANKKKWEIAKVAQGKTIVHINKKSLAKIEIEVPCSKEQQKIADCLSAYDEVIQIKKDKLEVWKEIKKGLLQQMFV